MVGSQGALHFPGPAERCGTGSAKASSLFTGARLGAGITAARGGGCSARERTANVPDSIVPGDDERLGNNTSWQMPLY